MKSKSKFWYQPPPPRTVAVFPAWKPGDLVEVIGTGLVGVIVDHTAANYSRWRVLLGPGGESEVEVGARDLRVPV